MIWRPRSSTRSTQVDHEALSPHSFEGAVLTVTGAPTATATGGSAADNAVSAAYMITNNPAGNAVAVYTRSSDGSLRPAGAVPTGGVGTGLGPESQGAVVITEDGQAVLAVKLRLKHDLGARRRS